MIVQYESVLSWLPELPDRPLRVQVLTNCTAQKAPFGRVAEVLYTGQQHIRVMRGVHALRRSPRAQWVLVDVLSARHGLIRGNTYVEPYERTFSRLGMLKVRQAADKLNIPAAAQRWWEAPEPDLKLILLGNEYMEAASFDYSKPNPSPTVMFCSEKAGARVPEMERVAVVTLGNYDAKRHGCGLISLKGELAARLLEKVAAEVRCASGGPDGHHASDTPVLRPEGSDWRALHPMR